MSRNKANVRAVCHFGKPIDIKWLLAMVDDPKQWANIPEAMEKFRKDNNIQRTKLFIDGKEILPGEPSKYQKKLMKRRLELIDCEEEATDEDESEEGD